MSCLVSRRSPLLLLLATAVACGQTLVETEVRLSLEDPGGGAAASRRRAAAADACGAEAEACTPANLAGRIYSAGAMWGELGPDAFGITMLGATDDVIQDPSEGIGGTLEFSLIESTTLAGKYAAPGGGSEAKLISRMEFNYDYLDAELTIDPAVGPAAGTYVVRTVFVTEATAPDVEGTMRRGDKLIRTPEEGSFRWCNSALCSESRDEVADGLIQVPRLVEYQHPGQGNPSYAPFVVPLSNQLQLSGDDLATAGSTWSLQFDMTDAALLSTPPAQLTSQSDLLAAFELSYEPDQQHAGETTAISAVLDFVPGP